MHYTAHSGGRSSAARTERHRPAARTKLLRSLGQAVRSRRTAMGLTMKALAKSAGVSERFLAQLEAGEGNISVARLEDVAEALETSGADLLLQATVVRQRPEVIALVGLRGAGKSSIGKDLAKRIGVRFVELDELIVREAQMTLSTIFEIHGERYYRSLEREVLRRLLDQAGDAREPLVVATGGSIVTDEETWQMLRSRARTVWLKATPKEHWDRVVAQGDVRPMRDRPRAKNELEQLLAARAPLYRESEIVVDTSKCTAREVVERVLGDVRS